MTKGVGTVKNEIKLISQDPGSQFNDTKFSVKNLLKDLLNEMRGCKCQITLQPTSHKKM